MNRIILLPLLVFILSCNSNSNEHTVETFGEAKSNGTIAECDCNDLVKSDKGLLLLKEKPFTGNCLITYKGSSEKYIEKQILNGVINGKVIYYGRDGAVIFEEHFDQGAHQLNMATENIRCNCKILNNKKVQGKNKRFYKSQLFTGTCFDVFPNSTQPYFEAAYENGVRSGFTSYFDKGGALLYTEKYRNDSLIEVVTP